MKTYKLEYTLGIGQQKILASLARRCRLINGWDEQELLQYAANARSDMEIKLQDPLLCKDIIAPIIVQVFSQCGACSRPPQIRK